MPDHQLTMEVARAIAVADGNEDLGPEHWLSLARAALRAVELHAAPGMTHELRHGFAPAGGSRGSVPPPTGSQCVRPATDYPE